MMQKKFNIAFLITDKHDGRGGLENVLVDVATGLENLGLETQTLLLQSPKTTEVFTKLTNLKIAPDVKIPSLISFQKLIKYHYWKCKFISQSIKFISHQFQKNPWDVLIILNLSKDLQRISRYLYKFKTMHPQIPIIAWPHISFSFYSTKQIKSIKSYISLFDATFAITKAIKTEMEEYFQFKNTHIIYNPIAPSDQLPQRSSTSYIYMGRIYDPRKQVPELLKALKNLKGNWTLDIFGGNKENNDNDEFLSLINQLGLDQNVTFHGWKDNPWDHIHKAGVLLLNSRLEGFGLVLVEAMMRGIPCISSDCPVGPNEIIQNNINGWLYDTNDYATLLKYLQEIIDGTRVLPSQDSIIDSVQKFSTENVLNNFKKQVIELIKIKSKYND